MKRNDIRRRILLFPRRAVRPGGRPAFSALDEYGKIFGQSPTERPTTAATTMARVPSGTTAAAASKQVRAPGLLFSMKERMQPAGRERVKTTSKIWEKLAENAISSCSSGRRNQRVKSYAKWKFHVKFLCSAECFLQKMTAFLMEAGST